MRLSLSRGLRTMKKLFLSRSRRQHAARRNGRWFKSRHFFEALEDRRLLATTRYVDNPGDFNITTDTAPPGLSAGDTVTWDPGAGSQHGAAVPGLIFGTNAFST